MWRDFDCSTATRVHIALYKEVLDPFGLSHCPLRNRMVEYDLSTSTSCVLNHALQAFSQRSHALLDVQLLSLLLAIQVFLLFCAPLCASTLRSFLLFSTTKMIANCKLVDMPQSDQQVVHQPLLQSCLNEVLVFHVALRLTVTGSAQRVRQFVW